VQNFPQLFIMFFFYIILEEFMDFCFVSAIKEFMVEAICLLGLCYMDSHLVSSSTYFTSYSISVQYLV